MLQELERQSFTYATRHFAGIALSKEFGDLDDANAKSFVIRLAEAGTFNTK
jgi:hypothetical protein